VQVSDGDEMRWGGRREEDAGHGDLGRGERGTHI
jgi:hypothetical protein